jgi:NAD-dependent dihydropyrimidine dehydrogenase PreA subunit
MKVNRKIIEIDDDLCDGCGECVPSCAEGALEIIDGKARLIAEMYCDGLGACLGECPTGALTIVEREVDDFDEEAVEELLKEKERDEKTPMESIPIQGCPSKMLHSFGQPLVNTADNNQGEKSLSPSNLSHWPIQINLIPPTAPFLKGADILVAADCTPVAYPDFHRDFLNGKVIMVGCPKFDDVQAYIDKFADIFKTADIKSITSVVMEVPCCSAMPMILKKALELAEKEIPFEEVVISIRGEILKNDN